MVREQPPSTNARPWRSWLRFSLRALLIVTGVLCVWLAMKVNHARRHAKAVSVVQALGGTVLFADGTMSAKEIGQFVEHLQETQEDIEKAKLEEGEVLQNDPPTDKYAGVTHQIQLQKIRERIERRQDLNGALHRRLTEIATPVDTANGQKDLFYALFPGTVTMIDLHSTRVRDEHLFGLMCLSECKWICLTDTNVSDTAIAELQKRLPKCKILH